MHIIRDIDKINRQVFYIHASPQETQDFYGKNSVFQYFRAPEGYKLILHSIEVSTALDSVADFNLGIFELSDGHYYTGWNIFPGIQNNETLCRMQFSDYILDLTANLNNWECKEVTLGIRSTHATRSFKVTVILWYYMKKMSKLETLFYAVIQPRYKWRKGHATTLDRFET